MINQLISLFRPPQPTDDDLQDSVIIFWTTIFLLGLTGFVIPVTLATGTFFLRENLFSHLFFLFNLINLYIFKQGYKRFSKYALLIGFFLSGLASAFDVGGVGVSGVSISFTILALLAATLLGYRATILIGVVNSIIIFVAAYLQLSGFFSYSEAVPLNQIYAGRIAFYGFLNIWIATAISLLTLNILNRYLRDNIEIRQRQEDLLQNLEVIVQQRTKDIQLAQEINRSVSIYTDLDELLSNSVETIKSRFDLYHVQIYFTDLLKQNLVLRAATGAIGENLINFSHRLPISPGSINGNSAFKRELVLVEDVNESSLFKPNPLLPETQAELSVPLVHHNDLLGILNVQANGSNQLTRESLLIFETVANGLSIAINNALLYDELAMSRAETRGIIQSTISRGWDEFFSREDQRTIYNKEFKSPLDEKRPSQIVSQNSYTTSIEILGHEIGQLWIENPQLSWGEQEAAVMDSIAKQVASRLENLRLLEEAKNSREQMEYTLKKATQDNWNSFEGEKLPTDEVFHFNGVDLNRLPINEVDLFTTIDDSHVQGPIQIQGQQIGRLAVQAHNDGTEEEINAVVQSISDSLSTHIENLRLTQEAQRRASDLSVLYTVNQSVQGETDVNVLLQKIGSNLQNHYQANTIYVAIYDEETEMIHFPYFVTRDESGDTQHTNPPRPMGEGLTSRIITSGQSLYIEANSIEEIMSNTNAISLNEVKFEGGVVYIGVPIFSRDKVIGVISMQALGQGNLQRSDLALLESLANSVSITIENTKLYGQTQMALSAAKKQSRELQSLNRIIMAASSTSSLTHSLQIVADELLSITPADQIGISMLDRQQQVLRLEATAGRDIYRGVVPPVISLEENPVLRSVIQSRTLKHFSDVPNDENFESIRSMVDQMGVQSMILAPIMGSEGVIGTIGIDITTQNNRFTEADLQLIRAVSIQASTIIENNRLLAETEKRAERESRVRNISDRIRRGTDRETILTIARKEISKIIGADQSKTWLEEAGSTKIVDQGTGPLPELDEESMPESSKPVPNIGD